MVGSKHCWECSCGGGVWILHSMGFCFWGLQRGQRVQEIHTLYCGKFLDFAFFLFELSLWFGTHCWLLGFISSSFCLTKFILTLFLWIHRTEHGAPLKEVVQWLEILQTYVTIHTHFTWRSCGNPLLQMSIELLGNGDVIHHINYNLITFAIKKENHIYLFCCLVWEYLFIKSWN